MAEKVKLRLLKDSSLAHPTDPREPIVHGKKGDTVRVHEETAVSAVEAGRGEIVGKVKSKESKKVSPVKEDKVSGQAESKTDK